MPSRTLNDPQSAELDALRELIRPTRQALLDHRIYRQIRGLDELRQFMQYHVFAVWDFMSLLKALQQRLTCVELPWVPPGRSFACRLVNEIVLGEESDEDGAGGFASHFELYLSAMRQCGADTSVIDEFVNALRAGQTVSSALRAAKVPAPVTSFVLQTFETIESNDIAAMVATFTFGREDLLPGLFRKIVDELNADSDGRLDQFRYYLNRHIAIDGDEHGPMAERLVLDVCGSDRERWKTAKAAAAQSLRARLELWESVSNLLPLQS